VHRGPTAQPTTEESETRRPSSAACRIIGPLPSRQRIGGVAKDIGIGTSVETIARRIVIVLEVGLIEKISLDCSGRMIVILGDCARPIRAREVGAVDRRNGRLLAFPQAIRRECS